MMMEEHIKNKRLKQLENIIDSSVYLKNDNYIEKGFFPDSDTKQSIINCLISKYKNDYPYSPVEKRIKLGNLKFLHFDKISNLYLNIREDLYENTARYVLGYGLKIRNNEYYLYSNIVPTIKNEKECDYIYVNKSYYDNYMFYDEIVKIGTSSNLALKEIFLSLPIILKNFYKIRKYLTNVSKLKDFLISNLKKNNLTNFADLVSLWEESDSPELKDFSINNKDDFFYILIAYYIDSTLGLIKETKIDTDTLNYMFYETIKKLGPCVCDLDFNLPKIVKINDFTFNKQIEREVESIPVLPPKQPTKKNVSFKLDNNETPKYMDVLKIKDTIEEETFAKYNYKIPEGKNIEKIPDNIKISSDILRETLFSHLLLNKEYFKRDSFNNLFDVLYTILNELKYEFITYSYKYSITFKTFVLKNNINEITFTNLYSTYFNIIYDILNYINNNNSIFNNVEIYRKLGCMLLSSIDIFGLYSFNNIVEFRYYIGGNYYKLVRLINSDDVRIVSLYTTIMGLLKDFSEKITTEILGGSEESVDLFEPNNFKNIKFFDYIYLLDVVKHLSMSKNNNSLYYKANIDKPDTSEEISYNVLFWDGIPYKEFSNYLLRKKHILTVINKPMFLINTINGTKMKFKIDCDPKDIERVCFIQNRLDDNHSVYSLMKEINLKLKEDLIDEKNIETFLLEFGNKFKNLDLDRILSVIKNLKSPLQTLEFVSFSKENSKMVKENCSLLIIFWFFIIYISNMGFDVDIKITKTNVKIKTTPALTKENLIKKVVEEEKNPNLKEVCEEIISKHKDVFNFLFESFKNITKDESTVVEGGSQSKIVLNTYNNSLIDNSITEKGLEKFKNKYEKDKIFTIVNHENIFIKEKKELLDDLNFLLNSPDDLSIENITRIAPNYVKTQIKLFDDDNDILEINRLDNRGGDNSNSSTHIIDVIINRLRNEYTTDDSNERSLSDTEINILLKERFYKTLDRLFLTLDSSFSHINKYDSTNIGIKTIIETIVKLEKQYKIKVSDDIKNIVLDFIVVNNKLETLLYHLFIVIHHIKYYITTLYNNTGIRPSEYNLNSSKLMGVYEKLESNIIKRQETVKRLYDEALKVDKRKLNIDEIDLLREYREEFKIIKRPEFENYLKHGLKLCFNNESPYYYEDPINSNLISNPINDPNNTTNLISNSTPSNLINNTNLISNPINNPSNLISNLNNPIRSLLDSPLIPLYNSPNNNLSDLTGLINNNQSFCSNLSNNKEKEKEKEKSIEDDNSYYEIPTNGENNSNNSNNSNIGFF